MTHSVARVGRDVRLAVTRGIRGRCPACGEAALFGRFLKPVPHCPACGEQWHHHRADDLPAYLVVLLLGHLLVPFIIAASLRYDLPIWVEMTLWPAIALAGAMVMIQPAKGAVIALQWAKRMHGFSSAG